MFGLRNIVALTALTSMLASTVSAHTWLEQLQVIGDNGSYIGDHGFSRGFIGRSDSRFTGYVNKWQLPSPDTAVGRTTLDQSDFLCHPNQRSPTAYTAEFPKLKAAPGDFVAMKYLENGHVTQPWIPLGKPEAGGTVFVYGTTQPNANEKILNVLQWTADGKGGDGKGWLMTTQNYDDGRCYQQNAAPISIERQQKYPNRIPGQSGSITEQWCETDLKVPENQKVGTTLTTYWVWNWSTAPYTNGTVCGKDEWYTTCSDLDIVDGGANNAKIAAVQSTHTANLQDPQSTAVYGYQSRTAVVTTVSTALNGSCGITSITSHSLPASLTSMINTATDPVNLSGPTTSYAPQTFLPESQPALPTQAASSGAPASYATPTASASTSSASSVSTPVVSANTSSAAAYTPGAPSSVSSSTPLPMPAAVNATQVTVSISPTPMTVTVISGEATPEPSAAASMPVPSDTLSYSTMTTVFGSSGAMSAASVPTVAADSVVMNAVADSEGDVSEQPTKRSVHVRRHVRHFGN